jgi:hypothetical protein
MDGSVRMLHGYRVTGIPTATKDQFIHSKFDFFRLPLFLFPAHYSVHLDNCPLKVGFFCTFRGQLIS